MAKYDIDYACGHGSYTEQLVGKTADRESRIEWLEANKVCPDCYKAKKAAEDAAAPKTGKICLVPAAEPVISIEVTGQIEANKEALYALGYRWSDSSAGGLLGYLSVSRPKRVLALVKKAETAEEVSAWLSTQQAALATLGYNIADGLGPLDLAYLADRVRAQQSKASAKDQARAKLAEIEAADPKPASSPLRQRIKKIEEETGGKWNGKIYGKKGYWNFYVNDTKHTASDAEVAEREKINAAIDAWNAKYKEIIEAAK